MIAQIVRKLREFFLPEATNDGYMGYSNEPVELLIWLYNRLTNLADQLQKHAESAPYPHVSDGLRRMADEKQRSAVLVKDKIESLRGWVKESKAGLASGRNHWERVTKDLQDQRALESFLSIKEARLVQDSPDIAQLLRRIAITERAHRKILEELVARADPQAHQT